LRTNTICTYRQAPAPKRRGKASPNSSGFHIKITTNTPKIYYSPGSTSGRSVPPAGCWQIASSLVTTLEAEPSNPVCACAAAPAAPCSFAGKVGRDLWASPLLSLSGAFSWGSRRRTRKGRFFSFPLFCFFPLILAGSGGRRRRALLPRPRWGGEA